MEAGSGTAAVVAEKETFVLPITQPLRALTHCVVSENCAGVGSKPVRFKVPDPVTVIEWPFDVTASDKLVREERSNCNVLAPTVIS